MKSLINTYNPDWPLQFEKLKAVLLEALQACRVEIEHIGSTAIPGLAAKEIIDIDIVYHDHVEFEAIKLALQSLDYFHNGDQGIIGREVFKRNNTQDHHQILDKIRHHLYVCHESSYELKRHLKFRDYLRINEKARNKYQKLKLDIAKQANDDHKTYADLKEKLAKQFINEVTLKAIKFSDI